ncbi:hypothetical protein ACFSM5_02310 [Lacibacterium aquatile]|uniref:DUF2892 domain-containing protein n=1 Tax=Lacibacterium aquatile TaxID=1168082 RepID=A0ABW5DKP5_9PROT
MVIALKGLAVLLTMTGIGGGLWLWKDYGAVIALIDGAAGWCMPGL